MADEYLTIKELTEVVGGGMTPRMVRHYHQIGLLPQPVRSHSNYRLYTQKDVHQLRRIVALKQQGFQLAHIQQLLEDANIEHNLTTQLQQQYQLVIQQLARLRQTSAALEQLLGRDSSCQNFQAEAIAHLRLLEVETQDGVGQLEMWENWDAATHNHPEAFLESLQRLLPDLSQRSEIERDLLAKLVLACGDVSLVNFVRLGNRAITKEQAAFDGIAAARNALSSGCQVVGDVPAVVTALDQTRLKHLGCTITTLINDPHITSANEAEQVFWQQCQWKQHLQKLNPGCVLVVGYAPSVLMAICDAIVKEKLQPALIIAMPIGFSHAPAAKRQLMRCGIPYITTEGTLGGGLLAAVALNALAESLIEKPDCHCYLG